MISFSEVEALRRRTIRPRQWTVDELNRMSASRRVRAVVAQVARVVFARPFHPDGAHGDYHSIVISTVCALRIAGFDPNGRKRRGA